MNEWSGEARAGMPFRRAPAGRVLWLVVLLASGGVAVAADFAVRNGTVAGGGGDLSAANFHLVWTLGEPAMGTTSAGGFRLTSGFPATIGDDGFQGAPSDGAIFKDGFEDSPGDTP